MQGEIHCVSSQQQTRGVRSGSRRRPIAEIGILGTITARLVPEFLEVHNTSTTTRVVVVVSGGVAGHDMGQSTQGAFDFADHHHEPCGVVFRRRIPYQHIVVGLLHRESCLGILVGAVIRYIILIPTPLDEKPRILRRGCHRVEDHHIIARPNLHPFPLNRPNDGVRT